MRSCALVILLALLLAPAAPSSATAQIDVPNDPPEFSDLELDLICDVTAPTFLQVTMRIAPGFDGNVAGLVIERTELGRCVAPVRLAPVIFGTLLTGVHEVRWNDTTAVYGVAYRYRVVGIDPQGEDLAYLWPSFGMVAPIEYATCGDPYVGHGTVTSAIAPGFLTVCAGACWDELAVESGNPLLAPYLDTSIEVGLVGTIDCTLGNVEGCTIIVTGVVEVPCSVVATEQGSWGLLKSRFEQ